MSENNNSLIKTDSECWVNRVAKARLLVTLFIIAFILSSLRNPVISLIFIFYFPIGLIFWVNGWEDILGHGSAINVVSFLGWLFYFLTSSIIYYTNKKYLIRLLLTILVFLLIVNIIGCHVQQSDTTYDIPFL